MPLKSLDFMASKTDYETLPPEWNTFNLARFSASKQLWGYQREALRSAIAVLFKYYDEFSDHQPSQYKSQDKGQDMSQAPGQQQVTDATRREKLRWWYEDTMHPSPRERKTLNLSLTKTKSSLRELLADYYPLDEKNPVIDFEAVCNRMSFWMATGSGKTIVLVKLIEVLHTLMHRGEIPVCDVLFLTHREDLLKQFRDTVDEFNQYSKSPVKFELMELRNFPQAKQVPPMSMLGQANTLRVFYYRSDNLSDEHKQAIVDFRNYDNHGRWYVVLDEAHKGGAGEAKRKHIVNILTRAGFLFNFSATFTDPIDLVTTVHNFNLSEFISKGYGKHIAVLNQELEAFRDKSDDYSDEDKRKVVVKSMLLLAYTAQKVKEIRKLSGNANLYHHPMLLTLVNSVNTEDADLKLYFEQILAIGRGRVKAAVWQQAKKELWEELKEEPELLYEDGRRIQIVKEDIMDISPKDVCWEVYNTDSSKGSELEVLLRPGNRKEIAFKMKASDRPFALIKIGDISGWLNEKLAGYGTIETLEDESYFDSLNAPDSPINILMGSRSFYEGWDSSRPNVINFVNIGVGTNAKKFIMQAVGRGVRVQSWQGKRQRLEELRGDFDDAPALFDKLKLAAIPPETLYVMGTNRDALRVVLEELKQEKPQHEGMLKLELNPEVHKHLLLIPEYRKSGKLLIEERAPSKFKMTPDDLDLLKSYSAAIPSDAVLLLRHGGSPKQIHYFRTSLTESEKYYHCDNAARSYKNTQVMIRQVMEYFGIRLKDMEGLRKLDTEKDIIHFRHVTVDKKHLDELQRKIDRVLYSKTPAGQQEAARVFEEVDQMSLDYSEKSLEITRLMEERGLNPRATHKDEVAIEYLSNHYYNPAIFRISKGKRIDYLKHIINEESEGQFLVDLQNYVRKGKEDCVLKQLDWWMFSKLDEHTDTPFIPYYDPTQNRVRRFVPDFVFWGQKSKDYTILFVDPKGMENQNWVRKADGYTRLFEDKGVAKTFESKGMRVTVRLCFFTQDRNQAPEGNHNHFWMDNANDLFNRGFGKDVGS